MAGVLSPHVLAQTGHRIGAERTMDARVPADLVLRHQMPEHVRNGHDDRTEGARQPAAVAGLGVGQQMALERVQRVEPLRALCETDKKPNVRPTCPYTVA